MREASDVALESAVKVPPHTHGASLDCTLGDAPDGVQQPPCRSEEKLSSETGRHLFALWQIRMAADVTCGQCVTLPRCHWRPLMRRRWIVWSELRDECTQTVLSE
jgi:hypothetical protein